MKHTARRACIKKKLMPSEMYTCVTTINKKVYVRGRLSSGEPIFVESRYAPTYYVPLQFGADPSLKTHEGYDGTALMEFPCEDLREAKNFLDECPEAYGDIQPEYMMLADIYGSKDVPFDPDRLYIWNLDIEVARDEIRGYARPEDPFNPIQTISVKWRHMGQMGRIVYGLKPFTPDGADTYVQCVSEQQLLETFIADWRGAGDYPDIITGWNVRFFDLPYICARARLMLGDETTSRLSPFGVIDERKGIQWGQEALTVDIRGISTLDYYEVYRKFTANERESYRLDYIGQTELKKGKIDYADARSLDKLYEQDFAKFIRYNMQDVEIVDELEQKLKLIDLIIALTYTAKCNFADTFRQVRLWDIMVYHRLRALGKQIPPRKDQDKTEQYAGAFVKEPTPGYYKWIVSFDVASMYPHIIREWNLSPEMIVDKQDFGTVEDFLARKVSLQSVDPKYAVAVNGALMRKDAEGFLPAMLKELYEERTKFKKMMNAAKKALEHETDPAKRKQLERDKAAYNNQQAVRKVNLNSAYGALGNQYFRYYDVRLAEAVTVTGQLAIRWVAQDVNAFMNKANGTSGKDYIIASDTDSIYIEMEAVASRLNNDVNQVDTFCQKFLQPLIDKSFAVLADYLRVYHPCLSMVRDVIADKAIWTAKKRYAMNVLDSEGVRYEKPQLKIMGMEAIKSSTPSIVRKMITSGLELFMRGEAQENMWAFIEDCKQQFTHASFVDIAFPRGVNGLQKYEAQSKHVPIHVAGALAFNRKLDRDNLTTVCEPIHEGEKIRFAYLRQPNPFHTHVLAAPVSGCPEEWNVEAWVDYETQFDKTFLEPFGKILECAGWTTEKHASLF